MSAPQLTLPDHESRDQIRSRPCPDCCVCGAPGESLYEDVNDRLFGAPGMWNLKRCPNPACGLLWLDPMPLEDDIAKAYRSYYTHGGATPLPNSFVRRIYAEVRKGYLESKYGYRCIRRNRLGRLLALLLYLHPPRRRSIDLSVFYLKSQPNGRLLEVGCGDGSTLELLKEFGWRAEGVDFDAAAVERARKRGLVVHLGTLAGQKLPENSFDAIVARHFIEHVPDPIEVLRECRRLLRPGGLLVLVTPNARSLGHRFYLANWRGLEPPRHLHVFTRCSLAAACSQADFSLSSCRSVVRANTILLESRMLRRMGKADSMVRPRWVLLWTEVTGFFQWVVSLVDCDAGEEIVMISAK
jgi:SAM-dependent methyltransferase